MEQKYTKGPWEIDKRASLRVIKNNNTIASCAGSQSGDNLEEQQANAKLISAAPELLEACAKAYLLIEAKVSDNLGLRIDCGTVFNKEQVLSLIEKAIQKATE